MRSEVTLEKQEPRFAAFVSIDWGHKKHVWCLQAASSEQREGGELEHTPEAVEVWVGQLCQRFAHRPIAMALEQSRGALVFMLSKYDPLYLFPVPSTMSANMRKALYPSGSKDDPRDADLLLELLLKHRDNLRRLSPDTEATRRGSYQRWFARYRERTASSFRSRRTPPSCTDAGTCGAPPHPGC